MFLTSSSAVDIVHCAVMQEQEEGAGGARDLRHTFESRLQLNWNPEVLLARNQFETHSSHPSIL